MTTHVVSAGAPIRLEQLEDGFHQPFADLPTSCDHAQEKVRQVRLAIEVLWRFTGGPSSPGETVFNARHAHYRTAAYRAILAGLGVTFEDLLVAQAPGAALDDLRSRLAQRLAVAVEDLPEFVLAEAPDFVEDGFAPFADDPRRESAADLLEERQTWAEGRRSALAAARTGAGGVANQYAAVLAESAMPDLQSRIDAVLEQEAAGHDTLRPVEQLAFSMPGFRETVALGQRAGAGLPLLPDQWEGLFAVLVEVEKRLRATELAC